MRFGMHRREQPFLKTAARQGCLLLCLLAACAQAPAPAPTSSVASPTPAPSRAAPTGAGATLQPHFGDQRRLPADAQSTGTGGGLPAPLPAQVPQVLVTPQVQVRPPRPHFGDQRRLPADGGLMPPRPATPTVLSADLWEEMPVIPTQISERVREIYTLGLSMGNNPYVFSRIGDCASAAPDFLVGFDRNYNLGEYTYLQPAIDYFQGSFARPSLAAKAGLNSAGLLTTLWTGPECLKNESLLDCQYRLDRPSFAFIAIGTNEAYYVHENPGSFEHNMRIILDDTISKGIIPILGTKADNVEGDQSINATIARLALEYQVPLWNFWLAVQPLPKQGMVEPEHLNSVSYTNFTDFSIPNSLEYGMQVRNLTALEMLNFLREQLAGNPATGMTPTTSSTQ